MSDIGKKLLNRPMEENEVGLSLIGDPSLEDCDTATWSLIKLFEAVGAKQGIEDLRGKITAFAAGCGHKDGETICEAQPVTWVAVERGEKIVRVARCEKHMPESWLRPLDVKYAHE